MLNAAHLDRAYEIMSVCSKSIVQRWVEKVDDSWLKSNQKTVELTLVGNIELPQPPFYTTLLCDGCITKLISQLDLPPTKPFFFFYSRPSRHSSYVIIDAVIAITWMNVHFG